MLRPLPELFGAQPFPENQTHPGAHLYLAPREIPQEAPHHLVRSQPRRSSGGQLPRGALVRPRREPVVRGHPLRANFPHRPERRMGAHRSIRRLAERSEDPQGRLGLHRRLQARPDVARPEVRENRDIPRDGLQRGLQGLERPALRRQRRSVLHRSGTDRHRRSERARVSPALERRTAAPGGQRALPQRDHPQQDQHARVSRRHALAADLAAAADGRRHAVQDRRRDPALRRARRPRRHRGGRGGRARRVPPRSGDLALRLELPADAPRGRGQDASPYDQHRLRRREAQRAPHHRLAERRDRDRRDAGAGKEDVRASMKESSMKLRGIVSVLALALAAPAVAQQYPTKPVRLLVGYAAGSSTDIVGRVMADRLGAYWKQTVIVENRGGAAGNVAADAAAKSPGDGYTLLFAQNGLAISAAAVPNLPYSAERDLVPLAPVAATPHILIVGPDFPAKNVQELSARAKAEPGKLTFASSGVGNSDHLCGELFNLMAGIQAIHVPYKGGAQAVQDVIPGRVAYYFAGMPV